MIFLFRLEIIRRLKRKHWNNTRVNGILKALGLQEICTGEWDTPKTIKRHGKKINI